MEPVTSIGAVGNSFRAPAPDATGRIHGIDAWRGLVLAILGVVLHASFVLEPGLWRGVIYGTIHGFRMEAFFTISGFLACRGDDRPGWIERRAVALMIPFAFTAFMIVAARNIFTHPLSWWSDTSYLWFLPVLMLCSLLPRWTPSLRLVIIAAPVLSLLFIIQSAASSAIPPHVPDWVTSIVATPYYGLFYLAGRSIMTGRITLTSIHAYVGLIMLLAWVTALFAMPDFYPAPTIPMRIASNMARSLVGLSVTLAILHHAARVQRLRWPMPQLSRAAYTIYLTHYPIISCINLILYKTMLNRHGWSIFVALSVMTTVSCLSIHYLLVARHPLLAFLLNGRPIRREAVARPPDPHPPEWKYS